MNFKIFLVVLAIMLATSYSMRVAVKRPHSGKFLKINMILLSFELITFATLFTSFCPFLHFEDSDPNSDTINLKYSN